MSIMEKYIDTDEVRVYYDVYGADKPKTVVLIHGFGLDRNMWEPQLSVLGECQVICLDVRGHGKSRPCDEFTIPKVCEDIIQILRAEACDTAAIVGLSMGSYVAQEFARLYPEKTAGVFCRGRGHRYSFAMRTGRRTALDFPRRCCNCILGTH